LADLSSRTVSLDDYRNSIVLVNNWATWCPPCKAEMPTLQKYYEDHAEQGFVVIAIESGESMNEVSTFVQKNSLTFPVWIDIKGLALEKFNNWDLPSSYVIDRNGKVRLTWTGPISMEMLEKYVTPLLEQ
jgi:thiol-disulfide isomerase/thioredoxin